MNIVDMYTIMKNMNLKNPQDIEKVLYNNKYLISRIIIYKFILMNNY